MVHNALWNLREFSPSTSKIARQSIHLELIIRVAVIEMRFMLKNRMYCGSVTFFLQGFNNIITL